jgi:hypothetical protein
MRSSIFSFFFSLNTDKRVEMIQILLAFRYLNYCPSRRFLGKSHSFLVFIDDLIQKSRDCKVNISIKRPQKALEVVYVTTQGTMGGTEICRQCRAYFSFVIRHDERKTYWSFSILVPSRQRSSCKI